MQDKSTTQLERIAKKTFEEKMKAQKSDSGYSLAKNNPNITDDPAAPLLYTKRAIQLFSAIFSVLFGSILLAINLNKYSENRSSSTIVVISGIIFTILFSMLVNYTGSTGAMVVGINGLSGVLITEIFWKRYIGSDVKYRKRSIAIPLIIGTGVSITVFLLMVISS